MFDQVKRLSSLSVTGDNPPALALIPEARFWLLIFTLYGLHDGLQILFGLDLNRSAAYAFAWAVLPSPLWGLLCMTVAVSGAFGLLVTDRRWHRYRRHAVITAFTVYGAVGAVFGTSIQSLTLQGVVSASLGAGKWWLMSLITIRMMTRPSLFLVVAE